MWPKVSQNLKLYPNQNSHFVKLHPGLELPLSARNNLELACNLLRSQGATVEELVLPSTFDRGPEHCINIVCCEMEFWFRNELYSNRTNMDSMLCDFVDHGISLTRDDYLEGLNTVFPITKRF